MDFQSFKKVEEISYAQIKQLEAVELIDVRNADEREQEHIGGKHIPASEVLSRIDEIDCSKPIVVYCRAGIRSRAVAKKLCKTLPQAKIYSLKGGILNKC